MGHLRRVLESLGLEEVTTYLQSGNATFSADRSDRSHLKQRIEGAIVAELGLDVPLILTTGPELADVIEGCPYRTEGDADPTTVHVTFLDPMPPESTWSKIEPKPVGREHMAVGPGVLYMHLPDGMGRATLPAVTAKATRDVVATTRNWRTVLRLSEMLDDRG